MVHDERGDKRDKGTAATLMVRWIMMVLMDRMTEMFKSQNWIDGSKPIGGTRRMLLAMYRDIRYCLYNSTAATFLRVLRSLY
jgi:hypothetical protein